MCTLGMGWRTQSKIELSTTAMGQWNRYQFKREFLYEKPSQIIKLSIWWVRNHSGILPIHKPTSKVLQRKSLKFRPTYGSQHQFDCLPSSACLKAKQKGATYPLGIWLMSAVYRLRRRKQTVNARIYAWLRAHWKGVSPTVTQFWWHISFDVSQ